MLQVGLGLSPVAAVAHAVAAGELADGALDAGPHSVALVPGGVLLVGAVADLQLVELARGEAHGALAVAGGGAGRPDGAGLALALGEARHDERGGVGPGRGVGAMPALADPALGTGDFPAGRARAGARAWLARPDPGVAGARCSRA